MNQRLAALAAAVAGEVNARSRRAFLLAVGAGLLASFALGASVLPTEIIANLFINYAVFLFAFAAALAALLYQQFGGRFGDALAVGGWSRLEAEARWRRQGAGRIPRSPAEARRWLEEHAEPGTLEAERFSAQLMSGDLVAARTTLAARPADTPYQRFDVESDRWVIEFLDGGLPTLDEVERLAADVTDAYERNLAAAGLATLRAHAALAQGADWVAPLAAARHELEDAAAGIIASRYIVPAWTAAVALTALLIGGALLFGRLTGVWR